MLSPTDSRWASKPPARTGTIFEAVPADPAGVRGGQGKDGGLSHTVISIKAAMIPGAPSGS